MSTAEKIYQQAGELPEPAQQAILQIVELLVEKSSAENDEWSQFSLANAMTGLEDERWPDYAASPQFEKWQ